MGSAGTHFRDVRAEDREMIRAAARRDGLSVGEWLDTVIKSAAKQAGQPPRSADQQNGKTPGGPELTTSALHKRIEHLAGQIEQLLQQQNSTRAEPPGHAEGVTQLRRIEDAINRLCDRLHSCIIEVPSDPTCYAPSARPRLFSRLIAQRN
jgi:hypothetical protein